MKDIDIHEFSIVESSDGSFQLIYIPDQDQQLLAGKEYRFVFFGAQAKKEKGISHYIDSELKQVSLEPSPLGKDLKLRAAIERAVQRFFEER